MALSKTVAQDMISLYIEAEKKVLSGQKVEMSGKSLTRADLGMLREGRQEWERKLNSSGKRSHALAKF